MSPKHRKYPGRGVSATTVAVSSQSGANGSLVQTLGRSRVRLVDQGMRRLPVGGTGSGGPAKATDQQRVFLGECALLAQAELSWASSRAGGCGPA